MQNHDKIDCVFHQWDKNDECERDHRREELTERIGNLAKHDEIISTDIDW